MSVTSTEGKTGLFHAFIIWVPTTEGVHTPLQEPQNHGPSHQKKNENTDTSTAFALQFQGVGSLTLNP